MTVIDVRDGEALPDRTVVIEGNRITVVGPAESVEIPAGARVVDGSGRYLIPGLWDMHTHLLWSTDVSEHSWVEMPEDLDRWTLWNRYYGPALDLTVANGVTGIREMWGNLEVSERVRREAAEGRRLAPRMVVAGHQIDGPPRSHPGQVVASTPARGRAVVDSLEAAGAAFIKPYSHLDPEVFLAVVERAEERGLPVAGHVPVQVPAAAAAEAGQRSFEHLIGVVQGCSAQEDHLLHLSRRLVEAAGRDDREKVAELDREWRERVLATQNSGRCRGLLETLARNRTWQVPTLVNNRARAYRNDWSFTDDPRLKYVPPAWRDLWLPRSDPHQVKAAEEFQLLRRQYERKMAITGMAAEERVPILAGTDTPNPFVFPGFGLHDELVLLVEAGLTPLEALQTATLNPARYLEATDSPGTVEEGKVADLVLLDANPLEDIRNTQKIAAVVLDGHYLDREALDQLLEGAERAANPPDADRDSLSPEDRPPAGKVQSDTVHVAPPKGETETDRASILAALEEVEPGGTIQFAPGIYLVGEIIPVPQSEITLQAHPNGTTLRGCEPGEPPASFSSCGVMLLTGGWVALRGFTIEQTQLGICISACGYDIQSPVGDTVGGYRIEDNTFRNSLNAIRGQVVSSDTTVIHNNRFINTFHAVGIQEASHLHVVDNRVSAPDPKQVPGIGHLSFAIAVAGGPNLVARNYIEGHPEGIVVTAFPGETASGNVIRENTIVVARNRLPDGGSRALTNSDPADSTVVGVPLLLNAWVTLGDSTETGRVSNNLVEENRILGAEGIGIELGRGSSNRIVGNEVIGIVPRRPFPGNTVSTNPEPWREANGSGIWVSPGSDGNEIIGNTFEDIAAAAVVVEGDSNRVVLASPEDEVRDLGSENRVSIAESTSGPAEAGLSGGKDADSSLRQSPLVCIDEAHQERHTAGGTYALFAGWLQAEGFRVDPFTAPFEQEALKRCGVLVVANALHDRNQGNWSLPTPSAFTPEEIEEVHSWVRDGGGLLLIADHMPFPGAARDLGDAFGLRFINGFAVDTAVEKRAYGPYRGSTRFVLRHRDGSLASHPITEGRDGGASLDSVVTYTGQVFRAHGRFQPLLIAPAGTISLLPQEAWQFDEETPVMDTGRWLQGAAAEFGEGRVVALGEAAQFRPDARGEARGANAAFATNVVRWLAGLDAP